jgi:hypothetical protein
MMSIIIEDRTVSQTWYGAWGQLRYGFTHMGIHATISLQRLRYRRTQVRMNFPAQSKIKKFGPTYRNAERTPKTPGLRSN